MSAPVNHSMPPDAEKAKALAAALAQIEKQFGKGTIMRLGEGEVIEDIQVVSTGSLGLDIALGVGDCPMPRGRNLRPRIVRQNHAHAASDCRNAKARWPVRFRRYRSTPWTSSTRKSWA